MYSATPKAVPGGGGSFSVKGNTAARRFCREMLRQLLWQSVPSFRPVLVTASMVPIQMTGSGVRGQTPSIALSSFCDTNRTSGRLLCTFRSNH